MNSLKPEPWQCVASSTRKYLIALLLVALPVGAIGCGGGVDEDQYRRDNLRLYESLPQLAGAGTIEQKTVPYRTEEEGAVEGYTTITVLRVTQGNSSAQVSAFFTKRLRADGWTLVERLNGPVLNFRKGRAFVSINLESFRRRRVEIAVDHNEGQKFAPNGS